jgi:A/G-specific adenine glycosylase
VAQAAAHAQASGIDARTWNYALLDYGTHLKRSIPNPSRRSAHHARQSKFEGSRRQKRAQLLRAVMETPGAAREWLAGALEYDHAEVSQILAELARDGFIQGDDDGWRIADS